MRIILVMRPLLGRHQLPAPYVYASLAEHCLSQVLIHAHRRSCHTASHVAHANHLQEPLDCAVLTVGAMQQREHNVDCSQIACRPQALATLVTV